MSDPDALSGPQPDPDTQPLSGTQIRLTAGRYEAVIASVGASLRVLRFDDRDLVVPFRADEVRPFFRGAALAPWPNRVIDGHYEFDGADEQLALTEPSRGHALHGLVTWADFDVVEATPTEAVFSTTIPAQLGYPHPLRVTVTYTLDALGLGTRVEGQNLGKRPAPWGSSAHPYLVAGPGRVDDWTLSLPADVVLETEGDRLLPAGAFAVDEPRGGELDFRAARPIGKTFIDHAYTALRRDTTGLCTVTVRSGPGADDPGVALSWGAACQWVQIHTADQPMPELDRLGLAVEPMTCAPDAFNSGEGLVRLEPGRTHEAAWRISAL